MIIFLYGSDSFRSRQKLDEIVAHYKESKKSGLNLMHIDAATTDFKDFYDTFRISPMFAEKKLITIKNLFSNKSFQEEFTQEVKNLQALQDVVVIYENTPADQRLKIFKILIKECKSQEFTLLEGKALKQWALSELEDYKQKANVDAVDLLISYVGNDLWRLSNEIKKLVHYKNGAVVRKEDVMLQVRPSLQVDIFKTIDALASKNKAQALGLLQKHLDAGDNALYLLSMVAWGFKNLLVIKELAQKGLMYNSIVKKSGLHPFVVKKNYFACQHFSFEDLKSIYQKMYQIDLDIKTGKIEAEMALDLLVASI